MRKFEVYVKRKRGSVGGGAEAKHPADLGRGGVYAAPWEESRYCASPSPGLLGGIRNQRMANLALANPLYMHVRSRSPGLPASRPCFREVIEGTASFFSIQPKHIQLGCSVLAACSILTSHSQSL